MLRPSVLWRLGLWHCSGQDWRHVPPPNWASSRKKHPFSEYW
jgi:hypothetical protein